MTDTPAASPRPNLSVQLGPLVLQHPLINASGTMEIFELAEALGADILQHPPVAAYVPKTVTLGPRAGNPPPRILETVGGMINSIGLSNEGLESFIARQLPRLLALPCPLILSIGGFSPQEYVALASGLNHALDLATGSTGPRGPASPDEPAPLLGGSWVERVGLELNISCPNVHSGCSSIGSDPLETSQVVSAVREVWPGLLVVKVTPNVTDLVGIARAAVAAGADAIAAVNTYKGLVIDRATLKPYLGNVLGGLSGPAIKPLALRAVYELFASVEVPIIGMGGVTATQDVLEFIACGARVVAVGSAGFRDPGLAQSLADGLADCLFARGIELADLHGRAHLNNH